MHPIDQKKPIISPRQYYVDLKFEFIVDSENAIDRFVYE